MKIRYKDFSTSMKALYWSCIALIMINITCLIFTLIPDIIPGGNFFIGMVISSVLTCFFLIVLALKRVKMKNLKSSKTSE